MVQWYTLYELQEYGLLIFLCIKSFHHTQGKVAKHTSICILQPLYSHSHSDFRFKIVRLDSVQTHMFMSFESYKVKDYTCAICSWVFNMFAKRLYLCDMFMSFESDKGKDYTCAMCPWVFNMFAKRLYLCSMSMSF